MGERRLSKSEYMRWVKTASQARYNLVLSDMLHVPLSALHLRIEDLEINGTGGYGFLPLNEAIANKCGVDAANVVPSVGTSLANHIAIAALVNPGDEVLLEHPTYELLLSTLEYLGAKVKRFHRRHEEHFAVDPAEVRRQITSGTKLIVLTNLHNPSSAYTGEAVLREVGEIASGAGAHVLIDEVYLDAAFREKPRSAFHLGETFVTTSSLTKVYGLSGVRCGWILASEKLADRMRHLTDLFHSTPAHPAELISVRAFERIGELASRSATLLEANIPILNGFFASCAQLDTYPHECGLVTFPKFLGADIEEFYTRLSSHYETKVAPGSFFGLERHFRIGIGKEPEMLREALGRLTRALAEA